MTSDLSHVLWIGGPPDCGKTTVATILAERHGLQSYHFDRHEMEHFARLDPAQHPALDAAHPDRMTSEQRWLGSTPEKMAQDTIASWSERFAMALDDLRAMPPSPAIIAEGPGMFPELVAPLLTSPQHAVVLIPSESFKLASVRQRGKPGNRHETSDAARATANLTQRDLLMTTHFQHSATIHNLHVIEVDGSNDVATIAAIVEEHFRLR